MKRQMQHPNELIEELHKLDSKIVKFDRKLALKITNAVGTMACAYLFAFIVLPGLANVHSFGDFTDWLSTKFLQLVLLSVIIVGQNLQASKQQAKADVDHRNLTLLLKIQEEQLEILNDLKVKK